MVSEYKNNQCKYAIDKLEKVVYLINEDALKKIIIDNGEAYVRDIEQAPLSLSVYDIELQDTDELDERYKFTHTLTFSMKGYANYRDFQGRYFAIVKTVEGVYWLVNPLFPCKVTYTYTLDSVGSHTDFTLSTISNHPTLRIYGIEHSTPYNCGYVHCLFNSLKLNESINSLVSGNNVLYTNDGFKDIIYNKNSAVFTEQFDGTNIQHRLDFRIKFDEYKSSWHYNLLEFVENRYAAIISTSCGKYILTGFHFGLQPSFTVEANDEMTMDNIMISLSDSHDNGTFISYQDEITVEKDDTLLWIYSNKYNGYECVGTNLAKYLLMEEVDALLNPTGNYKVLVGYEDDFSFLNIVGTFTETETFVNYECSDNCVMQNSFPLEFVFNNASCRNYSVFCDSDWSISSSSPHITVTPSTGLANQSYTVQICNTLTPTTSETISTLDVYSCGKVKTYVVRVNEGNGCFPIGSVFDISANAQYVNIPIDCCVKQVVDTSGTINNITIQDAYVIVYVPQNDTSNPRQFVLSFTYCDDTEGEAIINQGNGFERWVKETTACTDDQKCDVERKYTGTTLSSVDTWTTETRFVNCVDSIDCGGLFTRWIDTSETTCSYGRKYDIQAEQESVNSGATWTNTGNKRLGGEVADPSGDCAEPEEYEQWRENGWICDGTTKYNRLQRYISTDGINWIATDVFKRGDRIIEIDSEDCGYEPPSTDWRWEDWWLVQNEYVCNDQDKYELLRKYVSNDDVETKAEVVNWIATDEYKKGELIEIDSEDCGYDPSISGFCYEWRDDGDTICEGYDKYQYLRKYVRECVDCEDCSATWEATDIYKIGNKIEEDSFDCGYIPEEIYIEWRPEGWQCNGFDKYTKYRKYISEDGNKWYQTDVYKIGDTPIEINSTDCGYVPPIQYEYRWIETTSTTCVGTTKYYMYKKQRRVSGSTSPWEDVIPTEFSIDGDGTMSPIVAEMESTDCGYVPPIEPIYRWMAMDINQYYICADCDDTPEEMPKIEYRVNQEGASIQSVACNSSTTLVASDYNSQDIEYAKIYGCVTAIGNDAFNGRTNLSEVEIPSTVTAIGANAFSGCTSLVDFSLPMTVTSIGANAFANDIQLNKIMLPNALTSLGDGAFRGCKNFSSINIPQGVTIIGQECFYDCDGLTDIYLPQNVGLIKARAFANCNGLVNFTCYATEPPAIYSDTFSNVNENFKIYVPMASVDAYKSAWSAYANKIVGI